MDRWSRSRKTQLKIWQKATSEEKKKERTDQVLECVNRKFFSRENCHLFIYFFFVTSKSNFYLYFHLFHSCCYVVIYHRFFLLLKRTLTAHKKIPFKSWRENYNGCKTTSNFFKLTRDHVTLNNYIIDCLSKKKVTRTCRSLTSIYTMYFNLKRTRPFTYTLLEPSRITQLQLFYRN